MDTWNSLTENVVNATPVNAFKIRADFDWDYGKDYGSCHCCSIRTIVKLFCI